MIFWFFSFLYAHRDHFRCMHDVMFKDVKLEVVKNPFKHTLSTQKQPLRVYFDLGQLEKGKDSNQCTKAGERKYNGYYTETCTEEDIMTPEKLSIIKTTFNNVQQHLSELLKVDRSTSRSSYYDVRIVVNARPYGESDILAAASATKCEYTQNRPIEGQMYLNPKEIPKKPLSKDSLVRFFYDVLVHETFHVLGISSDLFPKWINPETFENYHEMFTDYEDPKYPGKRFRYFQTPNAIKVSQRRFGRKTLPNGKPLGIELELLGGSGTAGSHIKGRAYYNEIMSGISIPPEKISDITLALLEDTGWYEANYSLAEPLAWGDGKSFSDKEMSDFLFTPPDEFPDNYICPPYKNKEFLCNYDYTGVSECGVPLYVPNCENPKDSDEHEICRARKWYDSANSHWFGPSDVFDYMKILKAREWLLCGAEWSKTLVNESIDSMMTFGNDSTCSEIVLDNNASFKRLAGCYRTQCLKNGTVLKLKLSNQEEIICSRKGEIKYFGNLSIICQDPKLVCQMRDFNSQRVVSPHEPQTTPSPTTISSPNPTITIISTPTKTAISTPKQTKILTPKLTENNEYNENVTVAEEKGKNGMEVSIIVMSCFVVFIVIGISVLVIILCRNKNEIQPENDISEVLVPKPDGEKLEIDTGEQL